MFGLTLVAQSDGRRLFHSTANYLASPPLVVAYAIAGSMRIDITKDPIGQDSRRRGPSGCGVRR